MKYKWQMLQNHSEWYAGAIALLFTIVGIWAGTTWRKKNKNAHVSEATLSNDNSKVISKLGITPRELDVLHLMALGHSNQEIADLLFVSLNTVKTHISNLLTKLGAERRTQAIQIAKQLGLL
jgi:ATP/maltotriose-dependent transcriptional regulator MalT